MRNLGAGAPLPASELAFFGPRFGHDLSAVRIHTGAQANDASRAIAARAFTLGNDVAFANGEYRPGTAGGRALIAHELTHTVQQTDGQTLRRRWDRATTECAGEPATLSRPDQRWINEIQINQREPQSITLHWTDGTQDSHTATVTTWRK